MHIRQYSLQRLWVVADAKLKVSDSDALLPAGYAHMLNRLHITFGMRIEGVWYTGKPAYRIVATAHAENVTARILWTGRVTGDQENPALTMT